jgi:hypothetical protein
VPVAVLALAALAACAGSGGQDPDASRPPVVVLVLDEFPADALLMPGGRIDPARFPGFARLAAVSSWFPNGHTVYDSTFKAVPSILDARLPRPGTHADVRSHRPNAFHWLHGLGYRVLGVETASALCPPRICPGAGTRRPGILSQLAGGGRPARLRRWIGSIRPRGQPAFYFHHALLPHQPWLYLPSGRRDRAPGNDPVRGIGKPPGFDDVGLTEHNQLRFLLQVGFVDRQIDMLLRRLRRTGLLEETLLIVTADHGFSFDRGREVESRRLVSGATVEEIAPVPLFVKAPGQTRGTVNAALARNIDVVPTIADLLGEEVPWRHDGRSAFSAATRRRSGVRLATRDFSDEVRVRIRDLLRRREEVRRERSRLFGTGPESVRRFGDPWRLAYRIGPNARLLDRPVPALGAPTGERVRLGVPGPAEVAAGGALWPARLTGRIERVAPGHVRDLALAVNGTVRAVGRSFHLWRPARELFSFVVPEDALRSGRNQLLVLEVPGGGEPLRPLAETAVSAP